MKTIRARIARLTRVGGITGIACLAIVASGSALAQDGNALPRMADGKPDLSGIWWTGGDLGSAGFNSSVRGAGAGAAGAAGPGGRGAGGPGGRGGPPQPRVEDLYTDAARARAATLSHQHDPTLLCRPTAFGTLNVRLFDVGTLGQIVATPDMMVFLQETFHGYQLVPTDGRAHRDFIPPSYRGDSVGHWEGDTFVVETKNFTDDTWLYAEGRVSIHSGQLRIVERYNLVDANTLTVDATIEDPELLTGPFTVPTQRLVRSPDDQLLPLVCSGVETQALMDAAAEVAQ
jgi:hypothetical protein